MADTPETPDQPAKAPPKPRARRSAVKPAATKKPARAAKAEGDAPAAEPQPKAKAPPKPRSSKRATPRAPAKPAKPAATAKPAAPAPEPAPATPTGLRRWTATAIAGSLATLGTVAALLSLRSSSAKKREAEEVGGTSPDAKAE